MAVHLCVGLQNDGRNARSNCQRIALVKMRLSVSDLVRSVTQNTTDQLRTFQYVIDAMTCETL